MSPVDLEQVLPEAIAKSDRLPSMPAVAMEVLRLSEDENAGLDEYASVISRDPALAAKLLKLSNSALFSFGGEVTTLEKATLVLGMRTVQLMSLSFSLIRDLPKSGGAPSFQHSEYWRRSLSVAVAAQRLGQMLGNELADEGFLCGLLSHIGQLTMAQCVPGDYERMLQRAEGWPTPELEKEILGFDHCAIGAALLETWGMPAAIHRCVAHSGDPAAMPADAPDLTRRLTCIVGMGRLAVRVLRDPSNGEALDRLRFAAKDHGLSSDQVDTFLLTLERVIHDAAELVEIEIPPGESHYDILEEARRQMLNVGLRTSARLENIERRAQHLESENRKLANRANTDTLTTLGNRSYFEAVLAKELHARVYGQVPESLGLLMIDIDDFKELNDRHGHQTGDEALHTVGQAVKGLSRDTDAPARYGGDEFAIVVPSTTPTQLAGFAERIRKAISEMKILSKKRVYSVTVSIGGACISKVESVDDGKTLVAVADSHLYRAKKMGRNHCEIFSSDVAEEGEEEGAP
jgi:diguanylate cyclase (GGDEF)-like protein